MRFKISLHPEKARFELPYNYNYPLASAIYSFLGRGDASFSDFLHDEGFYDDGKAFKLFTFSPLFCSQRKAVKNGLLLQGQVHWFISSPREEFVSGLAQGVLQQGFLSLVHQRLIVEQVEVLSQPSFESRMSFRTLSPIVISTGELNSNGKFHKKYLSPEEPEFTRVFETNLRRKHKACYGEEPSTERISLELLRTPQSKLLDYKGTKVRGWFMHFIAEGSPALIRIGYEAGFGEENSAGFGMVEACPISPPLTGGD
ncbi:MAG: CRISPR-associated endoribonuclease Cas6 [Dehalococcoidia bacterium]|nr:CRISPR-associated endoribonuclease Cas6 [Dehalococcoidia bacterium]